MSVKLGENEYKVKVTLDTLMRIETAIGYSVIELAQKLSLGQASISEIVQFMAPVLRSSGKDLSDKDVQSLVWDAGLVDAMRVCAEVLARALNVDGDSGN